MWCSLPLPRTVEKFPWKKTSITACREIDNNPVFNSSGVEKFQSSHKKKSIIIKYSIGQSNLKLCRERINKLG